MHGCLNRYNRYKYFLLHGLLGHISLLFSLNIVAFFQERKCKQAHTIEILLVGGMDSFFMGSAQFVCCNLCRVIASEFNKDQ